MAPRLNPSSHILLWWLIYQPLIKQLLLSSALEEMSFILILNSEQCLWNKKGTFVSVRVSDMAPVIQQLGKFWGIHFIDFRMQIKAITFFLDHYQASGTLFKDIWFTTPWSINSLAGYCILGPQHQFPQKPCLYMDINNLPDQYRPTSHPGQYPTCLPYKLDLLIRTDSGPANLQALAPCYTRKDERSI